jgi:hypothetical protein
MVVFTLCTPLQSNFLVLSELRRGLFTIRLSSAMYIPRRLCRAWIRYFLLLPIYIDAFSLAPLLPVYFPGFRRWLSPHHRTPLPNISCFVLALLWIVYFPAVLPAILFSPHTVAQQFYGFHFR